MSQALIILFVTGTLLAWEQVKSKEEQVTIIGYDYSRTSCGGCWILQGQEIQLRSLELPAAYQKVIIMVLTRYDPDAQHSESCGFIKLTSIRAL